MNFGYGESSMSLLAHHIRDANMYKLLFCRPYLLRNDRIIAFDTDEQIHRSQGDKSYRRRRISNNKFGCGDLFS